MEQTEFGNACTVLFIMFYFLLCAAEKGGPAHRGKMSTLVLVSAAFEST